ncbi:MAG: hypothetical protein IPN48_04950 [Sphingomonadales bacterium]|nr:hypothetical protein [Sphingomonadales bacterium]
MSANLDRLSVQGESEITGHAEDDTIDVEGRRASIGIRADRVESRIKSSS